MPHALLTRTIRAFKLSVLALVSVGLCQQSHALVANFTAEDLRGTWVFTFTQTLGANAGGVYYLQASLGGNATAGNSTVEVLTGDTYGESPVRTVMAGGLVTVDGLGAVN